MGLKIADRHVLAAKMLASIDVMGMRNENKTKQNKTTHLVAGPYGTRTRLELHTGMVRFAVTVTQILNFAESDVVD